MAVTTAFQSDNERLNDDQKKRLNDIHAKYNAPGTSEATKKILHDAAEMIRAEAGYSGGTSGDKPVEIKSTKTKKAADTMIAEMPEDEIGVPNISDLIEQYNQAKMDSIVSGLKQARNTALSNLDKAQSAIKPKYYEARNAVSSSSQLGAKNFAEYLAQRGETNSGINDQAQISRNIATQGQIGGLRQQEAQDYANIEQSRADVNNSYSTDLANARAGLETATLQAQIDEIRRQQELALQQEQFNKQFGLQEAGVTGTYGGSPTLAAQNQQFNQSVTQQEMALKQQQFEESVRQNNIAQTNWQQQFTYAQMQDQIQNALARQRISMDQAQIALQQARFAAEQDPNSLDNQIKKSQLELNSYTKSNAVLNDTIQRLDSMYLTKNADGEISRNPSFSDAQLRAAIIGLGLSDDQTDALLLRYGLPIN
jgi:hypothetical protein